MVSYIILAIFIYAYIKCFSKAFIALIVLYPFLDQFIVPGFPIGLYSTLSLISFVFYILKYGINYNILKLCPAALSLLFLCFSYFISNYYASTKHYPTLILNVIQIFNIFIIYSIIKKSPQQYVPYFVRICYVFGGIVAIYALYEAVTRTNPYIQFVNDLNIYSQKFYITEVRFGIKRCQSFFSMHTTLGAVALILGCFLFYIKQNTNILNNLKFSTFVIFLLFLTVFLTGARSAILGTLVCLLMFFKKKYIKAKYAVPFFCIIGILMFLFSDYFGSIYQSILDTEKVGGSNKDMREVQLETSLYFLNRSFWFGNGLAYAFEFVQANLKNEINGAESMWFPIMIDQGFIGICCYIMFIISCIYFVIKWKLYSLLLFILGILIFNTMSSVPSFNFAYIIIYLYIMFKCKFSSKLSI